MNTLHELTPAEDMAFFKILSSSRMIKSITKPRHCQQTFLDEMKAFQALTPAEEIQFYPPRDLFDGLGYTDPPVLNFISTTLMTETVITSYRRHLTLLEWLWDNLLRRDCIQIEFHEVEMPLMARWRNTIVYHPALESEMVRQMEEWIDAVMEAWEETRW